jgi:hypothetical protein
MQTGMAQKREAEWGVAADAVKATFGDIGDLGDGVGA